MKFHWFHLMPYPDLPADFREKYRSVWIDTPSSIFDPQVGHRTYNDYLDELEYADAMGFDGICVNEHHQNAYGLMPSPNLIAAALTRRTRNAKIVLMGNSVALYNPPTRVAEEMAMLDVISGGRIVAGFPVGTAMDTIFSYGQNPATLREKYREGVELVLRAWQEPEPFSFNGKFTQLRYVNVWPRPIQQPRPPVWVPGGGSVETWEWCASHDFLYAYLSYNGYQQGMRVINGWWETLDRLGIEQNPYRTGFLQSVAVADSDAEAERLYAEHALYFYKRCLHVYPGYVNPAGYNSIATVMAGMESQVQRAVAQDVTNLTWRFLVDNGYIIAGSAATVTERLGELADKMRVGHLMLLCHFGSMPKETAMYNTSRFATEVMPKLRHRFSEWEDKWWPKEMPGDKAKPAPLAAE
jgi:alkanesulfonate monooxygenase SsuD/methylene tetrahydromethanopterin reductase-like flavin-dependent oxidoreductase (luciferase family)